MPPSHLTAKRIRRRTQRRRAVASQTTSAMRPPRRRGGRRVPAAGPSSVAGPASPSWPARLPTREDRARGQILGKMACLRNLQSNIARDGGRMTRSSLHSRLRTAILHGIDTWNVFSIARGEELRPFSTCVRRYREHCSTSSNTIKKLAELGRGPPQAAWRGSVVHPSGGPSAPGRRCWRLGRKRPSPLSLIHI